MANSPLARFAGPAAVAAQAPEIYATGTDTYERRLGLDTPNVIATNLEDRGYHTAGNMASAAKDVATRSLGALSDMANVASFGGLRYLNDSARGEGSWDGKDPQLSSLRTPYTPRPDSVQPWGREGKSSLSGVSPGQAAAPVRGAEDFTAPLRDVPANMPAGLRDGMVYKTRDAKGNITYSGRNVSGDVSGKMLNGDGTSAGNMRGSVRTAAGAPTFGPNGSYVTDDQAPPGADKQRAIDQSLMGPGGTKMTPGDVAIMGANQRDGVDLYRGTSQDVSLRGGGAGGRDSAEIARLKELIASPIGTPGRKSAAALLQQHMQNQGSMDVAKLQQSTTLKSKQMEIDIAQARRNAIGQAAQAAPGDPVKTAQILSNLGLTDDAAHFTAMAGQAQTREKGAQDIARSNDESATKDLESMAVDVNKNGESVISQGKLSTARGVAKQVTPGYFNMDANKRAAVLPQVQAGVNIVDGMNASRNTGWLQKVGWDGDSPEISSLPNLNKAKVEEVGAFEGLRTPNVSRSDYAVRLADGTTRYIPRNKAGVKELETLRSQGATLAK
jgi:hypothetical protein